LEQLKAILIGILCPLVAYAVIQHYIQWCAVIIRLAASQMPSERIEICTEEWLANLDRCKSMFTAFPLAFGCIFVVVRIAGTRIAVTSGKRAHQLFTVSTASIKLDIATLGAAVTSFVLFSIALFVLYRFVLFGLGSTVAGG